MRTSTKITAVLGGTALAVATAGVAYAYWTTSGLGTGSATTSSGGGTITLHSNFADGISPAGSVAVTYKADSTLSYSTRLGSITVGALSVDAAHSSCNLADFHATATLVSNPTVPANSTGVTVATGTLSMDDTDVDQGACKGAIISIPVTSS